MSLIRAIEGFNVISTDKGHDAVDLAKDDPFDIIVTDLGLPDMPGDIVIQQIRRNGGHQPRIVVYTGYGESHAMKAMTAGADVVLTKAAPFELVLNAIRAVDAPDSPSRVEHMEPMTHCPGRAGLRDTGSENEHLKGLRTDCHASHGASRGVVVRPVPHQPRCFDRSRSSPPIPELRRGGFPATQRSEGRMAR